MTTAIKPEKIPMTPQNFPVTLASWMLAAVALAAVIVLQLLPALLAGLLVYELVDTLTPLLQKRLPGERARWLAVALLGVLVIGLLTWLIFAAVSYFRGEAGNPAALMDKVMLVVDRARAQLPPFIVDRLPDSVEDFRLAVMEWLRAHVAELQFAGKEAVRIFISILIGMILGALIALDHSHQQRSWRPLSSALIARCTRFATAFRNVVFAQIKISLLNTLFTAIFLLGVLPILDIHLPLSKTLVALTFVVGLLPVVGNLISNTLIVAVALSVSLWVAVAALVFLILIHKLEYFLNARIVGAQISAKAWELLLAMLVMEAAFGPAGIVAAPIYYAYLKSELQHAELV